jgi:hypothetical protein
MMRLLPSIALASLVAPICVSQPLPSVSWQIVDQRVTLHEPVLLRLTVVNQASEVATVDLGPGFTSNIKIKIITPGGAVVERTLVPSGFQPTGKVPVQAGATYTRLVAVDEWYDFESVGEYGIAVSLFSPVTVGTELISVPNETFFTAKIAPRDDSALQQRCRSLNAQAEDGGLGSPAEDEAMRVLGLIRDPVVIPYLAQLGARSTLEIHVIQALEKFTTDEAVSALLPFLHGDDTAAISAKVALQGIMKRTQDPSLRQRIAVALENAP